MHIALDAQSQYFTFIAPHNSCYFYWAETKKAVVDNRDSFLIGTNQTFL